MFIGHLLLKKPEGWVEKEDKKNEFKAIEMFKNKEFLGIWLMFFINIHCGLALITYEKQILKTTFAGMDVLTMMVAVIPSVTAAFNALGRIGYSTISDKLKERNTIYKIIFATSIIITSIALLTMYIKEGPCSLFIGAIVIGLLVIVNAGYGGGFSTLPALLSERYGMEKISKIHGLALSAWAIAGITGNNMSEIILNVSGKNYNYILIATLLFYILAMIICFVMVGNKKVLVEELKKETNSKKTTKKRKTTK